MGARSAARLWSTPSSASCAAASRLHTCGRSPPRSSSLAAVPQWFDELAEFLRIPSISADPERAADVANAGEWVCELIRQAGGEAELLDWNGKPLAVGELRASRDPGDAPTVICYGHFDVQPPDPLALWESP